MFCFQYKLAGRLSATEKKKKKQKVKSANIEVLDKYAIERCARFFVKYQAQCLL